MKTVPPEVKKAVFEMESVIGTIGAAINVLRIMQDGGINTSKDSGDADALCWVVGNLLNDVRDLDRQWTALFEMTREAGTREGGEA